MENNKVLSFAFTIVAIILGVTIFKQFDFENLRFKKTGIAIVYIIGFAVSIYLLTRNIKNQPKK
jgi:predicted ferric reductase